MGMSTFNTSFGLASLLFLVGAAVVVGLLFALYKMIRYGSESGATFNVRAWIVLKPIAYLSGQKEVIILNSEEQSELIVKVLKASSSKGKGIENWFAQPAWLPIYNIESVDGEKWRNSRKHLHRILSAIDFGEVSAISERVADELIENLKSGTFASMDAKQVSLLAARVYYALLFGEPLPKEDENFFYEASVEWRKEVAVKGKGDPAIKNRFVTYMKEKIENSSKFDEESIEAVRAMDIAMLTAVLQPFFISPMVNFSDIFTALFSLLEANPIALKRIQAAITTGEGADELVEAALNESIRLRHPFPILERELTRPITTAERTYATGTQFYIELDQFKQSTEFSLDRWLGTVPGTQSWITFGVGPRMCMGKTLALKTMVPILRKLFADEAMLPLLKPGEGHKYSGRNNDSNGSDQESTYGVKTLLKTYYNVISWRLGLTKTSE